MERDVPYAQVFHEVFIGSDHCPILLNTVIPPKRVPRLFKFESMCTTSPVCEEVIASKWQGTFLGSPMSRVSNTQIV